MKNFLDFIKKIREWYRVPRYRALVQLGLCMAFLIFTMIIFRLDSSIENRKNSINTKNELNYLAYDFKYHFITDDNTLQINGTYENNKIKYDEDLSLKFSNEIIEKLKELEINNLYSITNDKQIFYETRYANGDKEVAYNIELNLGSNAKVIFKWVSGVINFVNIEFDETNVIDNNGNSYDKVNIYINGIVK